MFPDGTIPGTFTFAVTYWVTSWFPFEVIWIVPDGTTRFPVTPRIVTPFLMFPAYMFESIELVTPFTVTYLIPTIPLDSSELVRTISCWEVNGLTVLVVVLYCSVALLIPLYPESGAMLFWNMSSSSVASSIAFACNIPMCYPERASMVFIDWGKLYVLFVWGISAPFDERYEYASTILALKFSNAVCTLMSDSSHLVYSVFYFSEIHRSTQDFVENILDVSNRAR
jgi:hypothetical protein